MPDHDFFFALDLSDEPHFDRMLQDLSAVVLRYVGFDSGVAEAMTRDVRGALSAGSATTPGACDVRFAVRGGTLFISIAFAGGRSWETTHVLPAES